MSILRGVRAWYRDHAVAVAVCANIATVLVCAILGRLFIARGR